MRLRSGVPVPKPRFLMLTPWYVWSNYQVALDDEFADALDIRVEEDATLLTIVTQRVPLERSTVNLFSPIVVNQQNGLADSIRTRSERDRGGLAGPHPVAAATARRRSGGRRDRVLTLTREVGEKIVIGDDVVVTVISVSENGRVRLGIEAPRQIRIDRAEVLERIRRENLEAGSRLPPCLCCLWSWPGEREIGILKRSSSGVDASAAPVVPAVLRAGRRSRCDV